MFNIILSGVGGQGTVLAAKILSAAAMEAGKSVRSSETIGMAQRGGSVVSHIRISDTDVDCAPLVKKGGADLIIAFEPSEAVRVLPFLKDTGVMVAATGIIPPTTLYEYQPQKLLDFLKDHVKTLKLVDGHRICEECGSYKVLNMVLVGAAMEFLPQIISRTVIEKTILSTVKPQFAQLNLTAIQKGMDAQPAHNA